MPADLSTLTPVLKEVYDGGVNDQLNEEHKAWSRIKSTSKGTGKAGGKYVNFAIHTKRNNGLGSRNEWEALPEAGHQGTAEGMLQLRSHYATIELTGQAIELVNEDYQAFISGQKMEVERIKNDIAAERNKQFFGDGTGVRTIATGAPVGQVIPVVNAGQLDEGGRYDIHAVGTAAKKTTVIVTEIDETENTVTVTGTVTGIVATDGFVRFGSYDREIHGIGAILSDTTTLYGIDPEVERVWRAQVKTHATPTAISELMLLRMNARIKKAGGKTSVVWTTPEIQRAYFALLQSSRRFVNTQKFEGGYSGLAFQTPNGEIPLLDDWDAPAGNMAFLDEAMITRYSKHEGYKVMDRGGGMWRQKQDANGTYDAYTARMYEYSEMGTYRRNTHGLITNVQGDSIE